MTAAAARRGRMAALLLPLLAGLAGACAAQGSAAQGDAMSCPPPPAGAQRIDGGAVQAWWLPEPGTLQVGKPFSLQVQLCPVQARLLRVDAHMPEHRHGMNYRPALQPLGPGRWRAEGLLWHMPGRWEWLLDAELGEQKQRLTQSVVLR